MAATGINIGMIGGGNVGSDVTRLLRDEAALYQTRVPGGLRLARVS